MIPGVTEGPRTPDDWSHNAPEFAERAGIPDVRRDTEGPKSASEDPITAPGAFIRSPDVAAFFEVQGDADLSGAGEERP